MNLPAVANAATHCLRAVATVSLSATLLLVGASAAYADIMVDTPPEDSGSGGGSTSSGPGAAAGSAAGGTAGVGAATGELPLPDNIYEPWEGDPDISARPSRGNLPGSNGRERSESSKGAAKSGPIKSSVPPGLGMGDPPPPEPDTAVNSDAGKDVEPEPVVVVKSVLHDDGRPDEYNPETITGLQGLDSFILPVAVDAPDGSSTLFGWLFHNQGGMFQNTSLTAFATMVFTLTGGQLDSCEARGKAIVCSLYQPRSIPKGSMGFPLTAPTKAGRGVPICHGAVVDGSVGVPLRLGPNELNCEQGTGLSGVRFVASHFYADAAMGLPRTEPDGTLAFTPGLPSQGRYNDVKVWAVLPDGSTSWPFTVSIRNRYAPEATAPPEWEAIRGVEQSLPRASVFTDVDVDEHLVESGDSLRLDVVEQASFGGAWFDEHGTLHYQSNPDASGDYTDRIVVRAQDKWGAAAETTILIPIREVMPGCNNGGTTTDSLDAVSVVLNCWLDAPAGYAARGMEYSIVRAPAYGTIEHFDPVAGTFRYTPDPLHTGPQVVEFAATNNGAVRRAEYTVNVIPTP